jgi:hypothetical protein
VLSVQHLKKMLEILSPALTKRLVLGGPKPKLCLEDMFLASLEYICEYRTYAYVAASYGLSESQIFRIIRWVEDTLVKDGTFSLPGRKALLKSDMEYEVVLVDATESPVERPKKSKDATTVVRKKAHHKVASCCKQSRWQNYLYIIC